MSLLTDGIEHSIATALPVPIASVAKLNWFPRIRHNCLLRASQSMVPWICQRLDVARVCSKPRTACLRHQTDVKRSNFVKSVSFVQAFVISKMKKVFAFFKLILDHQRRNHSVLVVLPPLPIHFLMWQLIITAQHKDGNDYFNIVMVIMKERLLLYRAYLFDSKHILSISLVVENFLNIYVARYAFQRKGVSRSSYQELLHIHFTVLPFKF